MTYKKRFDGRKNDELRPTEAKVGIIPNATGSASLKIGNTVALAAVYGPKDLHPKFMQNPKEGLLRVHYNMMPFSGHGDRVRPGTSRRSKEICMVIANALKPVVDLKAYPNAVVDVFIELPQTDAGTRCAGICAASMALAHAGITMKELVSAVAVGYVGKTVVIDVNYDEEAYKNEKGEVESVDIPVAMLGNSETLSLLQMDGEIEQKALIKCLELAKKGCKDLTVLQQEALKEAYQ